MEKYAYQMRLILENMFEKNEKAAKKDPTNWICKMSNIVGGSEYQHAHADQAWPSELEGERTFPFVATHGFGVNPFQFWLLTKSTRGKNEYGMLHTLPCTALLIMRGDFVHAGGAMWYPRCHMKFYPRMAAGRVKKRDDNYWLLPNFKPDISEEHTEKDVEHVFLWQHYNFPFAYPHSVRTYNVKHACVDDIVTFPPELTNQLLEGATVYAATNRILKSHPI
jgi:hypothetical protein